MKGAFNDVHDERYPRLPHEFVMVPAFNRMLGGSPVNTIDGELLGPLVNSGLMNLDDAHLYLLDGLDLGKRSDLMVKGRDQSRWKDLPGKEPRRPQRRAKYS